MVDANKLSNKKSLNVALLGCLSRRLQIPEEHWVAALHANLAPKIHAVNEQAFAIGRGV